MSQPDERLYPWAEEPMIPCQKCDGTGMVWDDTACGDPDCCSPKCGCGACGGTGVI